MSPTGAHHSTAVLDGHTRRGFPDAPLSLVRHRCPRHPLLWSRTELTPASTELSLAQHHEEVQGLAHCTDAETKARLES